MNVMVNRPLKCVVHHMFCRCQSVLQTAILQFTSVNLICAYVSSISALVLLIRWTGGFDWFGVLSLMVWVVENLISRHPSCSALHWSEQKFTRLVQCEGQSILRPSAFQDWMWLSTWYNFRHPEGPWTSAHNCSHAAQFLCPCGWCASKTACASDLKTRLKNNVN